LSKLFFNLFRHKRLPCFSVIMTPRARQSSLRWRSDQPVSARNKSRRFYVEAHDSSAGYVQKKPLSSTY